MEIEDKGGEIVQRYEAWGEIVQRGRDKNIRYERGWTWTWTKREQHWRKEWITILGQEKHTSRGSELMNFD